MTIGDWALVVHVQLLSDPCLWSWTIRDAHSGEPLGHSWDDLWEAYASPQEALGAAERHLAEIVMRRRTGPATLGEEDDHVPDLRRAS